MKALVLRDYKHFEYEDWPEPAVGPEEVLVQVKACGICGSDVHGMDGSTGRRRPPLIMGHEASGVIVGAGGKVKDWRKGDRVTFDSTIYCENCAFCRKGQINLCDNRRVLGVSCVEYCRHGALAERIAVPQHILYRMPEAVSFEQAAMVEPVAIALHAVKRGGIKAGETAVVVGTGMIGLFVIQCLRVLGCKKIIGVDLEEDKLKLAKELGADVILKADQPDVVEKITEMTNGQGADLAMEVVGVAPTVQTAVGSLRKGGRLVLVGNVSPKVELPLQAVVTRELSLCGSCASAGEYPECMEMIATKKIRTDVLLSAVAPLSEGAAWFHRLYAREKGLMKVVLKPWG